MHRGTNSKTRTKVGVRCSDVLSSRLIHKNFHFKMGDGDAIGRYLYYLDI